MADPSLQFQDSGSGEVLICLHGFLESSRMWSQLETGSRIRKITVDLPGHGQSPLMLYNSMEDLGKIVMNLLDDLQISEYKIIGHSMGGYVALEIFRMDERCSEIILLNSNTWSDSEEKRVDRQRIAQFVMQSKKHFIYEAIPHLFWKPESLPEVVEELIREAATMEPGAIAMASLAMSRRKDLTQFAQEAGKRILIIQGEFDAVVPMERMRELNLDTT